MVEFGVLKRRMSMMLFGFGWRKGSHMNAQSAHITSYDFNVIIWIMIQWHVVGTTGRTRMGRRKKKASFSTDKLKSIPSISSSAATATSRLIQNHAMDIHGKLQTSFHLSQRVSEVLQFLVPCIV
ncbi:unnamed protein product [Malus baccata var. baccata]